MKHSRVKRVIAIVIALLTLLSLPEMVQIVEASPYIRLKVTYKVTVKTKTKKAAPWISAKKITFTKGEIRAIRLYNAKAKNVKWYSSNKKVATVKKSGKWCDIKARKPGKATITAKYKGKTYKCKITIKKKKKKAFTCYTDKGETLRFESGKGPYNDEKEWYMYDADDDRWYSDNDLGFSSQLFPISLTYQIGDTSIIDAEWEYDEDLEWLLTFYPKKAGSTYVKITNSYNSQSMYFPIVVEDDYVIPSERYFSLDNSNFKITDFNDYAIVKVSYSKDIHDVYCSFDDNNADCNIIKKEAGNGYSLFYIQASKNGTTELELRPDNKNYSSIYAKITADVPNSSIASDTEAIDMAVGDTASFTINTDRDDCIDISSDNDNVSILNKEWEVDGKSCTITIKGVSEGSSVITIKDNRDSSISDSVSVKVRTVEATSIVITDKIQRISGTSTVNTILNNTHYFHATVYPENTTNKNVTWEVSDPKVGKIYEDGYFVGLNTGTVTIRAKTDNGCYDEFELEVIIRRAF